MSKPDVVATVLDVRSADPAAAPFYRALEAIGARAADEALVALRLVLAGREPADAAVRRVRALAQLVRAAASEDVAGVAGAYERNRAVLGDVPPPRDGLAAVVAAARAAYHAEVGFG